MARRKKKGRFTKIGPDTYVGPSGRRHNYNQVRMYYTLDGWPKRRRRRKRATSRRTRRRRSK